MNVAAVQRRTLRLLFVTQIISGIGVAVGASVGALLAADIAGVGMSGLAQSAAVIGTALFAVPTTAIVDRRGRRPSLAAGYLVAACGRDRRPLAAMRGSISLLFLGFFLFGGANAAALQARYAAVDLAPAALRGRHLSLIVWATTLGAVIGPSLAPLAGKFVGGFGVPTLAGPYFFSALLFALAIVLLCVFLRPDPAVVARAALGISSSTAPDAPRAGMRAALRFVTSHPAARLGVSAMAVGNVVMIGVMAMTPVHIKGAGHDAAHTLGIVGLVLSFHIAGMYAFSPVFGWLTDRLGRRPVIFAGIALLLAACAAGGNRGARHGPSRSRTHAARAGLVGHHGGGVHPAQRVDSGGAARFGPGTVGSGDGTGGRDGRRDLGRDRRRVGIPDPDAAGRARHGAADRAGIVWRVPASEHGEDATAGACSRAISEG